MTIDKDEIAAIKAVSDVASAVTLGAAPDDELLQSLRKACTKLLKLSPEARGRVLRYVDDKGER